MTQPMQRLHEQPSQLPHRSSHHQQLPPPPPSNGTTASAAKPPVGGIKIGCYEMEATLGKGNNAIVKLARHRITKTEVAIKIIDKRNMDPENLKKVYREVHVLKTIKHPHIIKLFQVMESNNMIYLVTEYAPNGDIFDLIAQRRRLSEAEAREKFWQIISAVDHLHQNNIVHRDIKAENLLLDSNFDIKLADFGFSNFFETDETLNTYCGSPPYAAPEIFEGKRYTGPEIDIWSLGVVLYVLICGILPFEAPNLQYLRDRVLTGRIRIPFFMSTDCENLIRKMLSTDPLKRPTVAQIKKHKWMRAGQFASRHSSGSNAATLLENNGEPQPQIMKIMQTFGIESEKVLASLATDSYDNLHCIYLLLLERLKASTSAVCQLQQQQLLQQQQVQQVQQQQAQESRQNRRQSDAPRPRPSLNQLRHHATFQTTDCIMTANLPPPTATTTISQQPQYAHSDYEENCSTLSRQSTIGTIGSIDEGVETDPNGSSQSRTVFCASEAESTGSGNSLLATTESFDSQMESDIMSSLSSCPSNGSGNSAGACCTTTHHTQQPNNSNNPQVPFTADNSTENSPCASPQPKNFGEGWRASDNAMFDTLQTPFPTGQLGPKSKALPELSRPSTGLVTTQMRRLLIHMSGTAAATAGASRPHYDRRSTPSANTNPKRISLPENLEFQPQVLLNLKQSIHVEKHLGAEVGATGVEPKQVLKVRLQQQQQKRITKARMQLFRQQSYQLAQKQSVMSGSNMINLRLHEDQPPPGPPLSPIEDLKSDDNDNMDVS